ncbi:hypothetical protein BGZ65_004140, partial [Modicella reniformis]
MTEHAKTSPIRHVKKPLHLEIAKEILTRYNITRTDKQIANKINHITGQFTQAMLSHTQGCDMDTVKSRCRYFYLLYEVCKNDVDDGPKKAS